MRAFEGQRLDNQPVKRSREEKQKLLRELREMLAGMKAHAVPSLRQGVQKRIAELGAAALLSLPPARPDQRT